MVTTYYAMFEHGDAHPEEGSYRYGYFDSITETSFKNIKASKKLESCAKANQELDFAIWQVKLADIEKSAASVLSQSTGGWWRIEVEDSNHGNGIPATFLVLSSTREEQSSVKATITAIDGADTDVSDRLDKLFSASKIKGAQEEEIVEIINLPLRRADKIHVAVYDMGQANCNALVNQYEHPIVFFDLGWPIQANVGTAPSNKPNLFSCERNPRSARAPVILSHWDWDHWAYALSAWKYDSKTKAAVIEWNEKALNRAWIVPRPTKAHKLGPSHWALFSKLYKTHLTGSYKRALNLWPKGAKGISFRRGEIIQCAPSYGGRSDRNNTGLAVLVKKGSLGDTVEEAIVLPGDADYSSIPPLEKMRREESGKGSALTIVGLVASHHGGKVNVYSIPIAQSDSASLAISSGSGNAYGHPNKQVLHNYQFLGWKNQKMTESRNKCIAHSHTHSHSSNSIVLSFSGERKPKCGCRAVPDGLLCLN